jgi:hypothetical protein
MHSTPWYKFDLVSLPRCKPKMTHFESFFGHHLVPVLMPIVLQRSQILA